MRVYCQNVFISIPELIAIMFICLQVYMLALIFICLYASPRVYICLYASPNVYDLNKHPTDNSNRRMSSMQACNLIIIL